MNKILKTWFYGWKYGGGLITFEKAVEESEEDKRPPIPQPKEVTEDWIVYPPVSGFMLVDECQHGIYKLTKPHTIICTICEQVIVSPKEVEEFGDWINDLCRGA